MKIRFWLLQACGWAGFAMLLLLVEPADERPPGVSPLLLALGMSLLALAGSLGLRAVYRRVQAAGLSEFAVLAMVAACSLVAAVLVDSAIHAALWLLAMVFPAQAVLHTGQPWLARAPLLLIAYFLWSLLYVALSRQQRLRRAAATEAALQLALKEAQLQALLGQINPHFMFNAINNIRALVLKDAESAREMLSRFAATLRYQFSQQETPLVRLDEELAVVRDYVELLRLQLGARLHYAEAVDSQAMTRLVPRHSLQLLVENAIKHGLGLSPLPGRLEISVLLRGRILLLEVRNTGLLRDRQLSQGTGLDNLEQRLHLSFGGAARFELQQEGELVMARLRIEDAA